MQDYFSVHSVSNKLAKCIFIHFLFLHYLIPLLQYRQNLKLFFLMATLAIKSEKCMSYFFFGLSLDTSLTSPCLCFLARLGCIRRDDSALHRHPTAPLVLQQEEVRLTKGQEELRRHSCGWGGKWKSKGLVGTGSLNSLITHIGGESFKKSTVTKEHDCSLIKQAA